MKLPALYYHRLPRCVLNGITNTHAVATHSSRTGRSAVATAGAATAGGAAGNTFMAEEPALGASGVTWPEDSVEVCSTSLLEDEIRRYMFLPKRELASTRSPLRHGLVLCHEYINEALVHKQLKTREH